MPTSTSRSAAKRPSSAWLIWPFGVLLFVVCALVALGRRPVLFVPPELNIQRREDHSLGVPAMNPWDAWTGTGDPRTLQNWVAVVTVLAGAAFAVLGTIVVISRIRARRRGRRDLARREVPDRTFERVAATRAVTAVLDDSLSSMDVAPYVDDAIVACWQALERVAAEHGLPRSVAETSTDYAHRLADQLKVGDGSIRILAGLYREARFSGHDMPASAREAASRTLTDLRAELASPAGSSR